MLTLTSKILAATAFAAAVTLSLPHSGTISFAPSPAFADVDVDINVGTFYNRLSTHGDWVRRSGTFVFIPAVSAGWRPYSLGHWEYTNRYGWIWVSDEAFGWATYHYGRWGFEDDIGWYWVPATRWAPAWVSWRKSNGYVGWAPLPPDRDSGLSIHIDIDSDRYADRYWSIVPAARFLDNNLSVVVIRDRDPHFRRVFRETRRFGTVKIVNKIVVNNVITVTEVERVTKKKVRVKEVREVRDRDRRGKTNAEQGDTVEVFAPKDENAAEAKPKNVRTVEEIARKRKSKGAEEANQNAGEQPPATSSGQPAKQVEGDTDGQALTKKQRRELRQTQEEGGSATIKKKRNRVQQTEKAQKTLKPRANRTERALKQKRNDQQNQRKLNRKSKQKNCVQGANCPG